MKRLMLIALLVSLFAVQANAAMWEVDKATALGFTSYTMESGHVIPDGSNSLAVYDGLNTLVSGTYAGYGASYGGEQMSGQVGFVATIGKLEPAGTPGNAIMKIYDSTPGLTDTTSYDGISMYVQNDNQSRWDYQLFYIDGSGSHDSGIYASLLPGESTILSITNPVSLAGITTIGFRVAGFNMGSGLNSAPSSTDTFYVSVVPVPGALLLGFLGLSAAGIKLRKRA